MNRYKKYFQLSLILAIIIGFSSCEAVDSNYKHYLEEGEILYTRKPDSITALTGNLRVKLIPYLKNAFTVKNIVVSWNEGNDAKSFPFTKTNNEVDGPELIIDGLEEKTYEFKIRTEDSEKNTSVEQSIFSTIFGENFRTTLSPRILASAVLYNGLDVTITFRPSGELERGSVISFTNLNGELQTVEVPVDQSVAVLSNVDASLPITYTTKFVPTLYDEVKKRETSIDLFEADPRNVLFPLELNNILESITLSPAPLGVTLNWNNPENIDFKINVEVTVNDNVTDTIFSAAGKNTFYFPAGLGHEVVKDYKIAVLDQAGNGFGKSISGTSGPNLALNKPGSASSEAFDTTVAELTNGNGNTPDWPNVVHADNPGEESWFEIDLEAVVDITQINVYNRGDCCQERFSNFHVYISDVPFTGATNAEIQAQSGVTDIHDTGDAGVPSEFKKVGRTGRYIRIQTDGVQQYGTIAEIEVF